MARVARAIFVIGGGPAAREFGRCVMSAPRGDHLHRKRRHRSNA
jgi:hypothetical protein